MKNASLFALALVVCLSMTGSAAAQSAADAQIDIKELEDGGGQPAHSGHKLGPVEQAPQPAQQPEEKKQEPAAPGPVTNAPKGLMFIPQPNPAPLQWVPNTSPKDSELMDSYPLGASFQVTGIAQQGDAYVAILEWKGGTFVVQPGTMVPDQDDPAFQVRAITSTRVEAFDPVMRRLVRRSLPPMASRF